MTEFDEINVWIEKADSLLCSMESDKIFNIMMLAVQLREVYCQGKKDGIYQSDNAPRN